MLGDTLWLSSFFLFFPAPHLFMHLSLLLRQRRSVDVAASLKPTVAASAQWSRASFEISHGHSGTQFPCIRSHASAGHLVVHFVTGQMVGDRRSPGATILGERVFLLLPSTIPCRFRRQVAHIAMPSGVDSVRDGRSCTFGRVHFPVCSLRGVFVASCCGSSKRASTQRRGCWSAVSGEQEAEGR